MNNSFQKFNGRIISSVSTAKKVAVLVSEPTFDQLAAGLGIFLSLQQAGKDVNIFIPQSTGNSWQKSLAGAEFIRTDLQNGNLSIVLNYPLEKIDKVSSDDSTGKLKLVVKLKADSEPIDRSQVNIISQGEKPDLGLVIGNEVAFGLAKEWFSKPTDWIWFGNTNNPKDWADISIVEPGLSYSEMVARLIQFAGLPMNRQVGKNLYLGIKEATGSFEKISSYHTLETAALCFKTLQPQSQLLRQSSVDKQPVDSVENKEVPIGGSSFPTPKIFKGSTTPKI